MPVRRAHDRGDRAWGERVAASRTLAEMDMILTTAVLADEGVTYLPGGDRDGVLPGLPRRLDDEFTEPFDAREGGRRLVGGAVAPEAAVLGVEFEGEVV